MAPFAAGCESSEDAAAWLGRCGRAVNEYAQGGGYLHFLQEKEFRLGTSQGEFEQKLRVEGDIILPDREAYEYSETVSGSTQPEQRENTFSYLTVDGGKTAYVKGERLTAELGVLGWVRYTPQPGQNRYFDYAASISELVGVATEPEWLGYEDLAGERCAHVRYSASGQELIGLRLQEDPSLAERFQGIDMGEVLGELLVDAWIREADGLPRRVVIEQEVSVENGASGATRLVFSFSAYGEVPPLPIEAPAFFTEAV